jgi:phosphatidate cytidylyltransferase
MSDAARWGDLAARTLSGVILAVVGLGVLVAGDPWLSVFASLSAGLMIWELAVMTGRASTPARARILGVLAAGVLGLVLYKHNPFWLAWLLLPILAGLIWSCRDKAAWLPVSAAIMFACYALVALRGGYGALWVLWLVLAVAAVDILGYFGGRILGGPKFWPRLSPKKTWSGTISGWIGAGTVGALFWWTGLAPAALIPFSVALGFASQMGDIGESAVKRRAGVKDASRLIPGHGGVMDRFDGLSGAILFALVWGFFLPVPMIAGAE